MTTFTPVDDRGRVWQVTDLLSLEQTEDLLSLDWANLPWTPGDQQANWARRHIAWQDPAVQRVSQYISSCLPEINQALGTEFAACGGQFWLDLPGFTVPMHTDGHLKYTMQIYWISPDTSYGTGFYHHKRSDSLLYQFDSRPNTGYIMLNHPNDDGSQPLLWHGMFRPVPAGTVRLSSYWYFE